jgi:argininosuccinate lyase
MGAGALAGTSLNLDRDLVAQLLGFGGLVENSLDAVGSRDFILEALAVMSIVALDISRIAQDIIFYSCSDVALLEIPDEFCSTSSIMPQKKNPDPLELVRAKSGRVISNYFAAATIMHGLPSGYNLDFQEITPLAWQSLDILKGCLTMLKQLIPKLKLNENSILGRLDPTTATEIANVLVRQEKLAFRAAHQAVGKAVRITLAKKRQLKDLTSQEWATALGRRVHTRTISSIRRALDPKSHIFAYRTRGSPNPRRTEEMIRRRITQVESLTKRNQKIRSEIANSLRKLALS